MTEELTLEQAYDNISINEHNLVIQRIAKVLHNINEAIDEMEEKRTNLGDYADALRKLTQTPTRVSIKQANKILNHYDRITENTAEMIVTGTISANNLRNSR